MRRGLLQVSPSQYTASQPPSSNLKGQQDTEHVARQPAALVHMVVTRSECRDEPGGHGWAQMCWLLTSQGSGNLGLAGKNL